MAIDLLTIWLLVGIDLLGDGLWTPSVTLSGSPAPVSDGPTQYPPPTQG